MDLRGEYKTGAPVAFFVEISVKNNNLSLQRQTPKGSNSDLASPTIPSGLNLSKMAKIFSETCQPTPAIHVTGSKEEPHLKGEMMAVWTVEIQIARPIANINP